MYIIKDLHVYRSCYNKCKKSTQSTMILIKQKQNKKRKWVEISINAFVNVWLFIENEKKTSILNT